MTLVRPAIPILLLLILPSFIVQQAGAITINCDPGLYIRKMFVPEYTDGWFATRLQSKNIRNFDADKYLRAYAEFKPMSTAELMANAPSKKEFERYIAWLDNQTAVYQQVSAVSAKRLPTVANVLTEGSEGQKLKLTNWMSAYAGRKLTHHQIDLAASELSFILHDLKFNAIALRRQGGVDQLAKKMVTARYHEEYIKQQLRYIYEGKEMMRKEDLLDIFERLHHDKRGKWVFTGFGNYEVFNHAKDWSAGLLVELPQHRFAKISAQDMSQLMREGLTPENLDFMAKKYNKHVKKQIFYNTLRDAVSVTSKTLWIKYFAKKYRDYEEYQKKLREKDNS